MKQITFATIALCFFIFTAKAQSSYSIKGITVDTALKTKLSATVIVMDAKDSILRKSALSANDGSFVIDGLTAGRFLVQIIYPDYADFVERITLGPANKENDFGNIKMSPMARLLQEVIIKSEVTPVKIKGDTTEFNPRAYVIQPNDKVEDLLRQLPGIEIDKDGKITAQGVAVPKVLLDGEEFFRDDPTLITRNIRADMVDKVQLYDKKSDQATFTGIDDGVRTKTINIKLKEDKKVGYFGKVSGGAGNAGYYEGQGLFNRFKDKYKFSVYGTVSNDGKMGLGFQDNTSLGMGNIQISDDGGSITIYGGGGDALDAESYRGAGLPQSKTGGVHYDNKWNSDKESINTNYKAGSLGINTDRTNINQSNYNDYITKSYNTSNQYNYTFRQKADAIYTTTLSPAANLKFDVSATEKNTENDNTSSNITRNGDDVIKTTDNSTRNTKGHTKMVSADILYTQKLKKVGRTFSWDINGNYSNDISNQFYKSDLYDAIKAKDTLTNQYKPSINNVLVFNSNITYTEPITPKFALTFNYGLALSNRHSDQETYNQSVPNSGNYDVLDTTYSNNFKYNVLTNQVGAVFNYRGGTKTILTFGTRANAVTRTQTDVVSGIPYKRNYINWKPQVTFQYRPAQSQTLNLTYNGTSQQPDISQIQPIRVNANATNIVIGNPNLQPYFMHTVNMNYFSFKPTSGMSLNAYSYFSYTADPISGKTVTDTSTFHSVTQYVNLPVGNYNYSISGGFSQKIKVFDMQAGISANSSGNSYHSYNNNVLYANNNYNYGLSANLSKNKIKKYTLSVNGGPTWTITSSSPKSKNTLDTKSLGYNINGRATVYLPGKFQIASDIQDNYQPKTPNLPSLTTTMWNASINKTFLKEDALKLSVTANNILNQDQSAVSQSGNSLNQSFSNSIRRYFMFSISWDFKKFGTTKN